MNPLEEQLLPVGFLFFQSCRFPGWRRGPFTARGLGDGAGPGRSGGPLLEGCPAGRPSEPSPAFPGGGWAGGGPRPCSPQTVSRAGYERGDGFALVTVTMTDDDDLGSVEVASCWPQLSGAHAPAARLPGASCTPFGVHVLFCSPPRHWGAVPHPPERPLPALLPSISPWPRWPPELPTIPVCSGGRVRSPGRPHEQLP